MKKILIVIFTIASGLGLVFGDLVSVFAQGTEEFTLEEITVTALKREQNLQKVPVMVDTVTGEKLVEMGKTTLDDVLDSISTVLTTQTTTEMNVSIRGMDNDQMPGEGAAMVAITTDGVYTNTLGLGYSGMFDMNRVEVLAGPQGTLYSRNSSGGVVNMISNDPKIEVFDASGSIQFGNYDLLNANGMINIPINDKSAFRSAFALTDRIGYNSNGTDDDNTQSARLKYLYKFNEDLSVNLMGMFTRQKGHGQGDGVLPFTTEEAQPERLYKTRFGGQNYSINRDFRRYTMTLNWSMPIGLLTFIPSWENAHNLTNRVEMVMDAAGIPQEYLRYAQDFEKESSYELRMASLEDSFMEWMVGLYYYNKNWNQSSVSSTAHHGMYRMNIQKSVFANLTWPVSDRFRLTFGARNTWDEGESNTTDVNPKTGIRNPMFNTGLLAVKTSHFDYKLGTQYDIAENSMLWADYSTGYQQAPVQSGARSQTLKSYQAGIKSRFVDKMLQVNATGFYYDYSNFQVGISKLVTDPATGTIVTDRGSGISDANIYGLDFDTTYVFTENDSIKFAFSYLKTAIANLTIDFQYVPDDTTYNGLQLNNSPKFVFVGSYDHRFDLPNEASLTVSINSRYTTKTFLVSTEAVANPGNLYNIEPTHHISNASLNYASGSGKWSLNTYVKNIENHCTKNGTNGVNPLNSNYRVDPPRTFGAVLSMRY